MSLNLFELSVILLILVAIEGFYSGSEIALLSCDKLILKRSTKLGSKQAALALELAKHPERVLSTTLFITNLCIIGISALVELYMLENAHDYAELYAILVASPLIVLFGELLPKTFYQRNANRFAPWVSVPVHLTYLAFYPITRILSTYTTRLSRIVIPIEELLSGRRRTTRDEIRSVLSFPKDESEIKSSEKKIIRRIFDFKDTEAKHALIPLVRVDAIEDSASVQNALEKFERHRHSRMPVYSKRIDNIIGVLEANDLLAATDLQESIRLYITPANYVSETQSLEDLVQDMRSDDSEMVVVVDEHGGAVGILTFEDIVEEIVGEISDEYDHEQQPFKEVSPDTWSIQARTEIQLLNESLKLDIPEGNYETLSGFLLQQFGRIPETGDELFFDTPSGSFKFTIQKASERHIETVLIQKLTSNET
ncbi:MAG: HlyC/CorC family transporter [Bdellovibrio sp.]|nr:HlyC/CorC family transporter [Bdellovibrio sp.]